VISTAHSSDEESDADDGGGGHLPGRTDYGVEFDKAYAAWMAMHKALDWRSFPEYAGELPAEGPLSAIDHLLPLNVAPLYANLINSGKYGLVSLMAVASPYTIGALNAESFSERVISAANLIMDEGNTAPDDEELEMMVILRIDREFMKFMRSKYAHVQHETFEYSVLREEDNETDSEDDAEGEKD
jgi:hypothetical protein